MENFISKFGLPFANHQNNLLVVDQQVILDNHLKSHKQTTFL